MKVKFESWRWGGDGVHELFVCSPHPSTQSCMRFRQVRFTVDSSPDVNYRQMSRLSCIKRPPFVFTMPEITIITPSSVKLPTLEFRFNLDPHLFNQTSTSQGQLCIVISNFWESSGTPQVWILVWFRTLIALYANLLLCKKCKSITLNVVVLAQNRDETQ